MRTQMRVPVLGMSAAGMLLAGATSALAGGAVLTDRMLDNVTAGGAIVGVSSDALAAGVLAITNAQGNTVVVPSASPYPNQPGLGTTMGVSVGTASAMGSNLAFPGQGSPSSATSVTTGGSADGNLVLGWTFNRTVTGAGGVTAQVGWTIVYGAWVGL